MASTLTTFDAFLKENYTKDEIEALTYKERPLFGMIEKEDDHSGDLYVHPVIYANPQGLGATLAGAQAGATQAGNNLGALGGKKWTVSYGDYAGDVQITDKVIKASSNDIGSFLRARKAEVDALYEGFADVFGYYCYANQGFALGAGTIAAGVLTLAAADDVVNFEVGQLLVASAGDGTSTGHTLLGSGSIGYVREVNRNAGTVTVGSTSGGAAAVPAGWTGTMFFFRSTDFGGDAAPNRILLGLGAWVPGSDPTSTAFEGIDRTLDTTRLSGVRLTAADVAGKGVEARIKLLCARMMGRAGSKAPNAIMLHPEVWQQLADSLESRGYREVGVADAKFNYMKIKMATPGGYVDVYGDRFCPKGTIWALNLKFIKLGSYKGVPHVLNGDGFDMIRKSDANTYEYRIVAYPAFCVHAPGFQGRVAAP